MLLLSAQGERKWEKVRNTLSYLVSRSSTVVERLPHYHKVKGSRQATAVGTRSKIMAKSKKHTSLFG
jgi:hypothetical protein